MALYLDRGEIMDCVDLPSDAESEGEPMAVISLPSDPDQC